MIRIIFFALVALLSSALAHQDTKLHLSGNVITGLPDRYKSTEFIDGGKGLLINGKKLSFPDVIIQMLCFDTEPKESQHLNPFEGEIKAVDLSTLELKSSWYHFPSSLPPYLNIKKTDEERGIEFFILVNLEDVSLIEASVSVKDSRGWWISFPVIIEKPQIAKPEPVNLDAITGQWRSHQFNVDISPESIITTDAGEPPINLSGKISQKEPGLITIEYPDGTLKEVSYSLSGDILTMWWGQARSGIQGIEAAKVGSKTDTLFRELIEIDKDPNSDD